MTRRLIWRGIIAGAAVALLVVAANVLVWQHTADYTVDDAADVSDADAVIVLGAGIYQSGALTAILKDRVDQAHAVYASGGAAKILVSGDNSSIGHNEVSPVRAHLLTIDVPAEDIFLDYAGFDTYSSMYRAREVFGVDRGAVVTQAYHLPRAVFIAQALGMDVVGVPATGVDGTWQNKVREQLATIKALLDVAVGRTPAYLGADIPISGDGRESWGQSEREEDEARRARALSWQFEDVATDETDTPRTSVVLVSEIDTHAIGEYRGTCMAASEAGYELQSDMLTSVVCWWAGGVVEIAVFEEDGQWIVREGIVEEPTAAGGGFRGNYEDMLEIGRE